MQSVRILSLSLTLALCAVMYPWRLASAQTPEPPRFEDQIVVTPNRSESSLDRVPAFVTLLDRDDIAASTALDVPDLLRQAGISVTDIAGNGRSYRVDLRGFGATASLNTLVLVDGRPVNSPDLSGVDWFQIPLDRVARIEVVRGGGGAVAFGDNASGGIVNIVTFDKDAKGRQTVVGLNAGSYATFTSEAVTRGVSGAWSYGLSGRYNRTDGYRENSQIEGGDVGGEVLFRPAGRFELAASTGYHGDVSGLPGALLESELDGGIDRRDTVHPDDFAEVDDFYVMATPKVTLNDRTYVSIDVSSRTRNSSFFSSFIGGEFTGATDTGTIAMSPRIVWQETTGRAIHHLIGGLDVASASEDISNNLVFDGSPTLGLFTLEKSNWGVYVQDAVQLGKVALTGGYRYDSADFTFDQSGGSSISKDLDEQAANIGATFALSSGATVFGRFSRSFRYPVLDEFFDFGSNAILDGLVPQRSIDFEGGLRFSSGGVRGSVSAFRLATDDEIFFNPIGGDFGFGANENIDGQTIRTGFEASASTAYRKLQLGGTLTWLASNVDGGTYDGNDVPGVPNTRFSFQAQAPIAENLTLGFEGQYVGARPFEGDFAGEFPDQEDSFVVNAKVGYQRGPARVFLNLKNLFDSEYSEYGVLGGFPKQRAFYPSPGFHAIAGVVLTF